MSEWKEYKLGDLGNVITGKTPSKNNPEDWGNEMPFVTPSDYRNYGKFAKKADRNLSKSGIYRLKGKVLPSKSILVTCIGSDMGKVVINTSQAITNQQINAIIPNSNVDSDFLYYRLVSMYETLRIYGGDGTAVPIVNKGDFENIETEIPPLPEQKSIASILSSLDDKIDLLHRQNATLEKMAETLFRQWFVEETCIFRSLDVLSTVTTGKGLNRNEFIEDGEYPVLGANGEIGRTNKYLTNEKIILTGRVGTLGQVSISDNKVWISDNVLMIKPFEEKYFYPVYFSLKRIDFESMNAGSTQPLLVQSDLKKVDINLSEESKLLNFSEHCNSYFQKIKSNTTQIQTLKKLQDTLLPKLMSGEVRVEN